MDLSTIIVLAITGQRLLVVVCALTSIVIGWRLFARAIIPSQSGTISIGDWKVELKTVGPGVFFSLFGTIILTYLLIYPAEYQTSEILARSAPTFSAKGLAPTQDASLSFVRAINTIIQIKKAIASQQDNSNHTATLVSVQMKDLVAAADMLSQQRREILLSKFGAASIEEWEKNENTYRNSRRQLSDDTLARLDKIALWFTENVTDEGQRQ